jgi:hypothetical protein
MPSAEISFRGSASVPEDFPVFLDSRPSILSTDCLKLLNFAAFCPEQTGFNDGTQLALLIRIKRATDVSSCQTERYAIEESMGELPDS